MPLLQKFGISKWRLMNVDITKNYLELHWYEMSGMKWRGMK